MPRCQGQVVIAALGKRKFCEKVPQVSVGLDAVGACCLNQAIEGGACMGTSRRATEQPITPADNKRSDRVLNEIRVGGQMGTVQIPQQLRPLANRITDGFAQKQRRRNLQHLGVEPLLEVLENR